MYLLDTNVISESTKPSPAPALKQWLQTHAADDIYLSVITIGEIRQGIERLPSSKRKENLTGWLEQGLLVAYADFILLVDLETVEIWGRLSARLRLAGRTMQTLDSLIAATALQHNLHVVTRNAQDFVHTGVHLVDPWAS